MSWGELKDKKENRGWNLETESSKEREGERSECWFREFERNCTWGCGVQRSESYGCHNSGEKLDVTCK